MTLTGIVLEGGGICGIAHVGAIRALAENNLTENITHFAGSSAGAINAMLMAIGYSPEEMLKILSELDFKSFQDEDWGIVRDTYRLMSCFGFYKGNMFYEWLGWIIEQKLGVGTQNITFKQLHDSKKIVLVVTGTNVNTGETRYFSWKSEPDMPIRLAVRISMSIPLYFQAVKYKGEIYVDGGMANNYPIWVFDTDDYGSKTLYTSSTTTPPNPHVIGLKLTGNNERVCNSLVKYDRTDVTNLVNFCSNLVNTLLHATENLHIHAGYWDRTVNIPTFNYSAIDFTLSQEDKDKLVASGHQAMSEWIREHI